MVKGNPQHLTLSPAGLLVLEASPELARLLGVEVSQMVGRSIGLWVCPSERDDVIGALRACLRGDSDRSFAIPLRGPDGQRLGWNVRVELVRSSPKSEVTRMVLLPAASMSATHLAS